MAFRTPATIRNVALLGSSASGKTTLVESLLFKLKAIPRKGKVEEGTTASDFDPQEKAHRHSIDISWLHAELNGITLNLLDTPGHRDFVGQVLCALGVVECAVLLVDAEEGVKPYTRKLWDFTEKAHLPCVIAVNRADREAARPLEVLEQLRLELGERCVPFTLPRGSGPGFTAVDRVISTAPQSDAARDALARLTELAIETDDALLEKYLAGEQVPGEELDAAIREAVAARRIFPVVFTSGEKDVGVQELAEVLVAHGPPATNAMQRELHGTGSGPEHVPLRTGEEDPLCAHVFRVVSDPYVGKLSFLRIFSGVLVHNATFVHPHTGKPEKVGKLVRLQGKQQELVNEAHAGDFVALAKLDGLKTFDTILGGDQHLVLDHLRLPTPMYARAVLPRNKADEKKFAESVPKILDEDVTVQATRDPQTHEMVISGISPLHLNVVWERLKSRFGVDLLVREPKTPYLETIVSRGEAQYRHKKQTGGAGEFAEIWLRVEPLSRGKGIEFVNDVFGGAVSANHVASAEKGIRASLEHGVLAGYPVVDVKIVIFDGKEHPVDSKDIAFQKAGREAFRIASEQAHPVILEPIVQLEVTFPIERMGEIQGDLNRRRARVTGAESTEAFETLTALVPLAELSDYATSLGSMTGGQGSYSVEMSHYDLVPGQLQERLVAAAKAERAHAHS